MVKTNKTNINKQDTHRGRGPRTKIHLVNLSRFSNKKMSFLSVFQLEYPVPVLPKEVHVYYTFVPSGITRVSVRYGSLSNWTQVWQGANNFT